MKSWTPLALLLATSCAIPWSPEPTPGVYPHAKDYAEIGQHGPEAVADPELCATCHGAGAPACATCHEAFPHEPARGFTHPPSNAQCADCHQAAGSIASDKAACTSCHPSYPHPLGWVGPGVHGAAAIARQLPAVVCGNCHGPTLEGAGSAPGCADCHTAWPHPPGWDHGAAAAPDPAACAACHAADGGLAQVSCTGCHLALPHPADWGSSGHLEAAGRLGESTCLSCHDAGDGPPEMPATCAVRCHGGAP